MPEKSELKVAGGGIMERLAALQKAGDEEWKKKIRKESQDSSLIVGKLPKISVTESPEKEDPVVLRSKQPSARPVSLVDRLSKLNAAQTEWQKKVGEKDTEKFTVAGKMEREKKISTFAEEKPTKITPSAVSTPVKPIVEKFVENTGQKMTPTMNRFKGSGSVESSDKQTPRSSRPGDTNLSPLVRVGSSRKPAAKKGETVTVAVPKQDPEILDSFFVSSSPSSPISPSSPSKPSISTSDFDMISPTEPLLVSRKTVNKPRRNKTSKNPVKQLAARTDLLEEYTEDLFLPEPEQEKTSGSGSSVHSHLAAEALAGLASTEDFTSVKLQKGVKVPNQNMLPYRDKMLIQVKGRRFCQSRVVPPVSESLNSGDCYILLTPSQIFNWQGKFSNVIERSRSAEIAASIIQKKDLGCKGALKVETIEEEKLSQYSRENRRFWKCLTGSEQPGTVAGAGPAGEDEEYEQQIVETVCVYEVVLATDELVPVEEAWGSPPKYEFLQPSKVLVFDFGSELYVYNGKNAPFETRKVGARLAQELWNEGWDYSGCLTNPVYGRQKEMVSSSRPAWTVLGRINSCMETVIFREKFLDWPDKSRVIGKRAGGDKEKDDIIDVNVAPQWAWADLQGVDGCELAEREQTEPDLELEGSHLGRGRGYYDEAERRRYEISSQSVTAWHVAETDYTPLPEDWCGQFHSEDTYVVRWRYKVALTGRALKGGASKHSAVGRERVAYFFWQGSDSKVALQGASALHTVELDSERGPQIRVRQGREHAAFLQLWQGRMLTLRGRRGQALSTAPSARLFIVQAEEEQEMFARELTCSLDSLRSRGVFILLLTTKIIIWSGRSASPLQLTFAGSIAETWRLKAPSELGKLRLSSVETLSEGEETGEFLSALGGSYSDYQRLSAGDLTLTSSPQLYHMTSVLGTFEVNQVQSDFRKGGTVNNLMLDQSRLYGAEQPALFLVDCGVSLYLWQGWFPSDPSTGEESVETTGSGGVRWQAERRAAMMTILSYAGAKYSSLPPLKLVWAGHESREFINFFPEWVVNNTAVRSNQEWVESEDLEAAYTELSRTEYSWSELVSRPLPPGVDPAKIETYLSDSVFKEKFNLSKEEFEASPRWKQVEMKKTSGLF